MLKPRSRRPNHVVAGTLSHVPEVPESTASAEAEGNALSQNPLPVHTRGSGLGPHCNRAAN